MSASDATKPEIMGSDASATGTNVPLADKDEAERFLCTLDPNAAFFTFQTLDDNKERKKARAETNKQRKKEGKKGLPDPFAHVIHGSLGSCWPRLLSLNEQGAGVFVTINATDRKGRETENIIRVRAVFIDLDGSPLEPVLQWRHPPHIVIESSPGQWHAYWLVADAALKTFGEIQKELAAKFGGDRSVHDLPRVMRLPGFLHRKGEPFLSHLVSTTEHAPYTVAELFPDGVPASEPPPRGSDSKWTALNTKALQNLDAWVPEIFPDAERTAAGGYRVTSTALGRDLEEDLSFTPQGIKDFGIHDLGDPREGRRSPIDVVIEHGGKDFTAAEAWLQERLPSAAGEAEADAGAGAELGADAMAAPSRGEKGIRLVAFDDIKLGAQRRYLVKGLIPREGLVVIWGPPKSGKSFWTFDLMMHVALGWDYRGRRVQQAAVIYCAFEGQAGIEARVEAYRQRFLAEDQSRVPFYLEPVTLDLVKDHRKLIAVIQATLGESPPGAVVLDTLNRSLAGSESKDEDMAAYIHAADAIREAFNCVVIIVHHCGIDGTRPRGHTSLTGAADGQLAVKRDAAHNIIALVDWMKDGPEGDSIASALDVVTVGQDEDGEDITSCVVVPVSDADAKRAAKSTWTRRLQPVRKSIIEALTKHGTDHKIGGQGENVCAVAIERAREIHKKIYVGTGDGDRADAERNTWKRHLKMALDANLIGAERWNGDELVWLTEPFVLLKT